MTHSRIERVVLGLRLLVGGVCAGLTGLTVIASPLPPLSTTATDVIRGPRESPSRLVRFSTAETSDSISFAVHDLAGTILVSGAIPAGTGVRHAQLWVPIRRETEQPDGWILAWSSQDGEGETPIEVPGIDPNWVLHFNPGFHYDPVWWNTQAHYTETGFRLDANVGPGLELVSEYLRMCAEDPDYRIALHQIPYLKTFLERHPERRAELERRIADGTCSLVGGTYNELSTTLISAEATIRNAIYGTVFQTEVLGGDGRIFWQCDVFGHDPSFPSIMRDSGHDAGAFARGPFHQWGAPRDLVNFPSEFLWMSPDGKRVLTHYMTGHYGYAYGPISGGANRAPDDRTAWERAIIELFEDLRRPALTHHVLLPMHQDFVRPLENLGQVVRHWNETFLSPRATISTPRDFFDAVEEEIHHRELHVPVITRDMNPIYTGCAVSFADLKTANRACESLLREAEILATWATVEGAEFPWASIDRAWRQLQFNAHHDGVTGSMSDQVYLDILAGYHDAFDLARDVRERAIAFLADRAAFPSDWVVWNGVAHARHDWRAGTLGGLALAFANESTDPTDSLSSGSAAGPAPVTTEWVLENESLRATIDVQSGGDLTSLIDRLSGRELLRGPANELLVLQEYETLPGHGEGPWHLSPTGAIVPNPWSGGAVLPLDPARPHRIGFEARSPLFTRRTEYELVPGSARLDVRTEIRDWSGVNQLVRAEFPFDLPGAKPIFQTAAAVLGRPFARDVDTQEDSWTLDQTFSQWVGLGSVFDVVVESAGEVVSREALGVAEIVIAGAGGGSPNPHSLDGADRRSGMVRQMSDPGGLGPTADRLVRSLVRWGVTTTTTMLDGRRYGDLRYDSNHPDWRILLIPEQSPELDLSSLGISREDVGQTSAEPSTLPRWIHPTHPEPSAFPPVLVLTPGALSLVLAEIERAPQITVPLRTAVRPSETIRSHEGVALATRGPISAHLSADGRLGLNLLRSCTSWPAGVWIDGPERTLPDGTPFQTMHGSHVFEYSLFATHGDYRDSDATAHAQEYAFPLTWFASGPEAGLLQEAPSPAHSVEIERIDSFLSIDTPSVSLLALKPVGFPDARWQNRPSYRDSTRMRLATRLWNGSGRPVQAHLRWPALALAGAWSADLLERPQKPLPITARGIEVSLDAHEIRTVILEVQRHPVLEGQRHPIGSAPATLDSPLVGDPDPSAYWLENLGEGVSNNGVVSLAPARRELPLGGEPGARIATALRVVNNNRESSVRGHLRVRSSADVRASLRETDITIAPSHFQEIALEIERLTSRAIEEPILVTVETEHGTVTESIWIRSPEASSVSDGPIELRTLDRIVGGDGVMRVRLLNHSRGAISGLATWLLPHAIWGRTSPWRDRLTIGAQDSVEVTLALDTDLDSYGLLRFGYGGRVLYSEAVAITQDPERVILRFDMDRCRARAGQPATFSLTALSRAGLHRDSPFQVEAPPNWQVRELARRWEQSTQDSRLVLDFEVIAPGADLDDEVHLIGPDQERISLPVRVVPTQSAFATGALVAVDGDLAEWEASEFTTAANEFGQMRTAVRYGPSGLALAIEVTDERFHQPYTGGSIWRGDSVQLGISVEPSHSVGYDPTDLEFGIAKTEQGALVWCWYDGERGRTGEVAEAQVQIRVGSGRTVYELILPRSALPEASLDPGRVLGFSYIANDNDGDGFRGAIQWTRGMSGGKDSSLFGDLLLLTN